mmetsp:Transcript_26247/g.76532  ORF Transcript_26247/g.76532 Transcript_26247/m.76532 type:complete len:140 (-) Transcript_26247:636-1055(-)
MPISSETVSSAFLASLGPKAADDFLTQRFATSSSRTEPSLQLRITKTHHKLHPRSGTLLPSAASAAATGGHGDRASKLPSLSKMVPGAPSEPWLQLRDQLQKPHHESLFSLLDKRKRDLLEHSTSFHEEVTVLRQQCMD